LTSTIVKAKKVKISLEDYKFTTQRDCLLVCFQLLKKARFPSEDVRGGLFNVSEGTLYF